MKGFSMKKLLLIVSALFAIDINIAVAANVNAALTSVISYILSDGIVHNGVSYGTVTSPYTGRVWLDRNLGASRVCTSFNDVECYGDYYQWGRDADGHEKSNSAITTTQASNINSAGDKFIRGHNDWSSSDIGGVARKVNWLKTDGSFVCPIGFRVPTAFELQVETVDQGVANRADAFANFLKIPAGGYRSKTSGNLLSQGNIGFLWSSGRDLATPSAGLKLSFASSVASIEALRFVYGVPVRCIEKIKPQEYVHNDVAYGTVTSPYTGKIWLDRNLGANRVCTSISDALCFGDYYQWGRNTDGHEKKDSAVIATLANGISNVGFYFIKANSAPYDWTTVDSAGLSRVYKWRKTDGTSVCPAGFRVPSEIELKAETIDEGVASSADALANFLKLPSSGYRSVYNGLLYQQNVISIAWTSTQIGGNAKTIIFSNAISTSAYRGAAYFVRCIKD